MTKEVAGSHHQTGKGIGRLCCSLVLELSVTVCVYVGAASNVYTYYSIIFVWFSVLFCKLHHHQ
uniref:Uncharacterized protein n=1 Tax=Arundo donax TaxID=35708 RepID=A0A0A9ETR0_ARUDO